MKLTIFASGSKGNCLLISSKGTNILIDAGISARRIKDSLSRLGLSVHDLNGVLITHEHSDHILGLKTLTKNAALPIYTSRAIGNRLIAFTNNLSLDIRPISADGFSVGNLLVRSFPTPHDSVESYGYRVEGDAVFAIATDMGYLTNDIVNGVLGADTVIIEANHDVEMLKNGPYPYPLKQRILSDHGHLCNTECGRLAAHLEKNGTSNIILGHLSENNNTPQTAYHTVQQYLTNGSTYLCCAPANELFELEFGSSV